MKRTSIVVGLLLIAYNSILYATEETFFIVGDSVDIREQPSWEARVLYQEDWGRKCEGHQVDQEWYACQNFDYDSLLYVHKKHIVPARTFYRLAEERQENNGRTKYELLKHYKEIGHVKQAEALSFDVINNHGKESIVLGVEYIHFLGYFTYFEMRDDDYQAEGLLRYTEEVIRRSHDRVITALAYADQAHYFLQQGQMEKAETLLWKILTDYTHDLIITVPVVEYDAFTRVYPIAYLKSLFFALYVLKNPPEADELRERFHELRKNHDPAMKFLANNLWQMTFENWNCKQYNEYMEIVGEK